MEWTFGIWIALIVCVSFVLLVSIPLAFAKWYVSFGSEHRKKKIEENISSVYDEQIKKIADEHDEAIENNIKIFEFELEKKDIELKKLRDFVDKLEARRLSEEEQSKIELIEE